VRSSGIVIATVSVAATLYGLAIASPVLLLFGVAGILVGLRLVSRGAMPEKRPPV
jgi:hypothetical protein